MHHSAYLFFNVFVLIIWTTSQEIDTTVIFSQLDKVLISSMLQAIANAAEFDERVFAIAFTDSVHSLEWQQAPETVVQLYLKVR